MLQRISSLSLQVKELVPYFQRENFVLNIASCNLKLANALTQGVRDTSQDIGDLAAHGAHGRDCGDGN